MTTTNTSRPTITAPCGCTFQGRFYSTRECTVLAARDQDTLTGSQRRQHAMTAEKAVADR